MYRSVWLVFLLYLVTGIHNTSYAQVVNNISRSGFNSLHENPLIDSTWYFHAGELSKQQQTQLNTTGWDTLRNTAFATSGTPKNWKGIGWFATWVKIDNSLLNYKLGLRINHDGASEIFIDGKPVGGYGKVGNSAAQMTAVRALREQIPIWFTDNRPHLISIRYANFIGVYPEFLGFQVWITDYEPRTEMLQHGKRLIGFGPIFAAAEIILGLLHLFLFLFYPKQKLNLYVSVFVLLVGINGIAVYQYYLTSNPSTQYFAEMLTFIFKVLLMWSGVLLVYMLDYNRVPRWRLIVLSTVSAVYLLGYIAEFLWHIDGPNNDYFSVVFFIWIMDSLYSAYHLVKRRQKGAWLILAGFASVTLVYFFAWGDVFSLWPYALNPERVFVMSAGNLVLPFCLSLYLAFDFSRTNQALSAKLNEVEKLSAAALTQEAEKSALIAAEARRLESLVQQRTVELSEKAAKLQELDALKSRFFTNIAHEFKTPLTLIINPATELINEPYTADAVDNLTLILNNAKRLLQLINQLLDLSKLEHGLMEVMVEPLDLVALVKLHIHAYKNIVVQKGIALSLVSAPPELWVMGDKDKLDKIIVNLLSNAVKFTDEGGIDVFIHTVSSISGTGVDIVIRDTGRGIPNAKLPYIFSRFYQVDPSDTRSAQGTGIGLAIVKEMVDLLKGTIEIESLEGMFTEVKFQIPYVPAPVSAKQSNELEVLESASVLNSNNNPFQFDDDDRPLLLLIEDHEELRTFIIHSLGTHYRIIYAEDGENGIDLAIKHIPTLIITDLMMPRFNGYQVSSTLRKDERTSHIPIIILTAKADIESRIEGIKTGADAYLGKPFDKRELFAQIEMLINTREQLRQVYTRNSSWIKEGSTLPSIEQDFIVRVRKAVEDHLNEQGYSADELAIDLGLSRTQLHRKLKALTGQAPGELIRIVRLQYAHDLLERRVATVSEVAYMIGFSSPASFSASFSRHFGFTPSKVAEGVR